MDVRLNRDGMIKAVKKIRIETDDYLFNISVCNKTGNLVINKVDGKDNSSISVLPRYSNEIEIK